MLEIDRYTTVRNFVTVCVGNKTDLGNKREVSTHEAKAFCKQYGFDYIETSAKNDDNVLEAFNLLICNIILARDNTEAQPHVAFMDENTDTASGFEDYPQSYSSVVSSVALRSNPTKSRTPIVRLEEEEDGDDEDGDDLPSCCS
eukprot:TRINITY_DN2913_c0_g1_i2.p1 TRINITY_DN2913_c0_g1~~TRINITY_DN2913_c0_g1_i2.p1  ORF type:complete len:144 (+),score=14.13 TRINITY_DN2913_c0_g1_i2:486-917(+)